MENEYELPLDYHLIPTSEESEIVKQFDVLYTANEIPRSTSSYEERKLVHQHLYITAQKPEVPTGWYWDDFVKDIRNTSGAQYEFAKHIFPIIATTDKKLINTGVLEIVNIEEFVIWYNQKDNQKKVDVEYQIGATKLSETYKEKEKGVDVDKLAEKFTGYKKGTFEYNVATINFKAGYNLAPQSNAEFNLDDILRAIQFTKDLSYMDGTKAQYLFTPQDILSKIKFPDKTNKGEIYCELEQMFCHSASGGIYPAGKSRPRLIGKKLTLKFK